MDKDVQLTAADIARLGDVGRAAVSNWRRRHEDFPQPIGGTSTSPTFSFNQVKEWLRAHAEEKPLPTREWLWQELRAGTPKSELASLIAELGAFLLKFDRDDEWRAHFVKADPEATVDLLWSQPSLAARMPLLSQLVDIAVESGARETFGFLCTRYFEMQRIYVTPAPIAAFMASLIDPYARSVLDPACGAGSLLRAAHERLGGQLFGQDLDEATARLTAVSLAFDVDETDIRPGDALRTDAFPGTLVDAVVCNPPFNDRNWGYEELAADARWEYGLPPKTEPELAWGQHALAHLTPGGSAVLLMPPAAAGRRSGRRIRAQLLRRGALRAVIALPVGSVPNMSVGLTVWVLCRPTGTQSPGHVLMVDTSARADEWGQVALAAWDRFTRGDHTDEPGVSRVVPVIDMLDDDVDLLPGRYLPSSLLDMSPERIVRSRDRLDNMLAATLTLLPRVEVAPAAQLRPLISLSELERRGLLTIHQQATPRAGEVSEVSGEFSVLTAEDVIRHEIATGQSSEISLRKNIRTRRGDVVVPLIVRKPVARVITDEDAVIGLNLSLLRPDPEHLDPDFLAGFLTGRANLRHYVSMSSAHRVDVRRAEVPLLPIDQQRAYGRAFRHLWTFAGSLRQLTELGGDLVQDTLDGLTQGIVLLSPDDPSWKEPITLDPEGTR
ncbi:N-6 DNA methylase [Herbidospora sp. NBRC 101105]|uniref:N-6 DNA methylase n=1 Tax=Herbidospora sp. NBRC 101105 TaxID=3032195 RepID=UPI0024A2D9E1|nr:N-6 DNA methylase [Herbidospora sp. NBRC 101105]GLX96747.1 type II restriction endonuclease subunit M [Herbidospora sp. NBRC 101105]